MNHDELMAMRRPGVIDCDAEYHERIALRDAYDSQRATLEKQTANLVAINERIEILRRKVTQQRRQLRYFNRLWQAYRKGYRDGASGGKA